MTEPVELKTERLLLRPIRLTDLDAIYEYQSDEVFGQYHKRLSSRKQAEEEVAWWLLWEHPNFVVELSGKAVGQVSLRLDTAHEIGGLGYNMARPHWGRGLATEAAGAVVDWGFETHGLAKIYAAAYVPNVASWRVMEKLGMTREAVFRSHVVFREQRFDDVYYGILREEWEALGEPPLGIAAH